MARTPLLPDPPIEPPPPATPEAALARLAAEKSAAETALGDLSARRAALFASDAADAEIEAADVEIARARRKIERAVAAEPGLRAAAEAAQRERTEAEFAAHYDRYRQAQDAFLAAYRAAFETRARLAALIDAGVAKFGSAFVSYSAFPRDDLSLEKQSLETFEAEAARALAAESRRSNAI